MAIDEGRPRGDRGQRLARQRPAPADRSRAKRSGGERARLPAREQRARRTSDGPVGVVLERRQWPVAREAQAAASEERGRAGRRARKRRERIARNYKLRARASLSERLRERIAREGPISFVDFMQAALYDPEEGYYARGAAIGEGGDFVTSPHVSPGVRRRARPRLRAGRRGASGPGRFRRGRRGRGPFPGGLRAAVCARMDPRAARPAPADGGGGARRRAARRSRRRGIEPAPRILEQRRGARGGLGLGLDLLQRALRRAARRPRHGLGRGPAGAARGRRRARRFVWVAAPAAPELLRAPRRASASRSQPGQKGEIAPGRRAAPPAPRPRARARMARARSTTGTRRASCTTPSRGPTARSPCTRAAGAAAIRSSAPGEHDLTAHVNWDVLLRAGEAEGLHAIASCDRASSSPRSASSTSRANDAEKWRDLPARRSGGMGEETLGSRSVQGTIAGDRDLCVRGARRSADVTERVPRFARDDSALSGQPVR